MTIARYRGQIVFCRDVPATADLYERSLGFQRGDEGGGDIGMRARVARHADATVEIYLHPAAEAAPVHLGTFEVDDVDTRVGELAGHGWEVTALANDTPWGAREATVMDPNGHTLTLNGPAVAGDG